LVEWVIESITHSTNQLIQ